MEGEDSRSDQDKKRRRRDFLLAILLLLLGLLCLWATATLAVQPEQTWQVSADMLSRLDPDTGEAEVINLAPISEKALTPLPTGEIFATAEAVSTVPVVVIGKLPTSTPTQEVAVVPTAAVTQTPVPVSPPTSTPGPTDTPRPSDTPTPPPTSTPTPTSPPTPTFTQLPTLTFTPIPPTSVPPTSVPPTSVPPTAEPPTDTPTPTDTQTPTNTPTFTPTPTNTPVTPTPMPPPTILSIVPNQGLNTAPVLVTITGTDFMATPTVLLGSTPLTVSSSDATTINATVPAGLTPGVYALTVTNPDTQSDTLPAAYTVLAPVPTDTTLETGYLMTYGSGASGDDGDDDYVQVIFFEVPTSYSGPLWLRIYDADTGGGGGADTIDELRGSWDTTMTYTLRCGNGAYTPPARSAHPSQGGIDSGPLLDQAAIGPDPAYHDNWGLVFGPHSTSGCELSGSSAIFKFTVQSASGNDGNAYNVILSTDSGSNIRPAGSRIFAYSWTFLYTSTGPRPPLYPYVPAGTTTFAQYNWDFDYATGDMTLHTPVQDILVPVSGISGNGAQASSAHAVGASEDGTAWTVTLEFAPTVSRNTVTFWATGDGPVDLAIFANTTASPPP